MGGYIPSPKEQFSASEELTEGFLFFFFLIIVIGG